MTLFFLCFSLWSAHSEPITRVLYALEITEGGEHYSARMVLNQLNDQYFSLACRKTPGGTLFTYWATPEHDVLWFPHSKTVFSGPHGDGFRLLPGGPELTREKWLQLLSQSTTETLGRFKFWRAGEWYVLSDTENAVTIRWRELKRQTRDDYNDKVLIPSWPEDSRLHGLPELDRFWSSDGGP